MIRQLTVKFWFLQNLDLPDENIMKGVDGLASLLNVSAKGIWNSAIKKQANSTTKNKDRNLNHSTGTPPLENYSICFLI